MGFQDREYVRARKLDYDGGVGKKPKYGQGPDKDGNYAGQKKKAYYGPDRYGNYPGGEKKRLPDWVIAVGVCLVAFLAVKFGLHWR